ncbi:hypothetical protein ON010_g18123 [Phytophthora cinnamomi]|nr:hypothetical protein ON010_g18123 [Phytophthora cinnamomi]
MQNSERVAVLHHVLDRLQSLLRSLQGGVQHIRDDAVAVRAGQAVLRPDREGELAAGFQRLRVLQYVAVQTGVARLPDAVRDVMQVDGCAWLRRVVSDKGSDPRRIIIGDGNGERSLGAKTDLLVNNKDAQATFADFVGQTGGRVHVVFVVGAVVIVRGAGVHGAC